MRDNKKKLIPSIILILLISAIQNTAIGQQTYDLEKVVPPSPTAAALGAYGDVPVSYYTGQASLGIPLYQIKTSQHQLNIDLSYNSSIRVNQDASWVGLGWSLNAGGVITRSVRGIDDFDNDAGTIGQGYYYAPALPATDYDPEDDPMDTSIYRTFNINGDVYGATEPDAVFLREVFEGRIDTEPDIFYYNFAGYSGSFVLGKQADGSVVYLKNPKDELKIEIDFNNGSEFGKWNATTPEGYVYHFATVETSENLFTKINLREDDLEGLGPYTGHLIDSDWEGGYAFKENAYEKQYATAWYLDYIEAPNGERITFGYAGYYGSTYSNVNISQTRYDKIQNMYLANPQTDYNEDGGVVCEWWPQAYGQIYNNIQATKQIIHNVYLESITFENGHITFETSTRKDIEKKGGTGPQKLSGIKVYSGNKQIKGIILDHDYFNTSHQDNNLAYRFCRLKLEKIYESGKPPYEFEYFDPNGMPSKYDKHVDDWGFYNPLVQLKVIGDRYWPDSAQYPPSAPTWLPEVEYNGVLYPGTTRKPDDTGLYSRRGMLKKVTYPTGGNTVFDYEPNVLKLNTPEIIETYEGIAAAKNSGNLDGDDVYIDTFNVTSGSYKLSFWGFETYADPPMSNFEVAWLKNSQGTVLETFYLTDPEGTYESRTVTLASGTYTLEVLAIYNYSLNAYFGKTVTSSKYYKTVGGQRIAKITNRDANDTVTSLKKIIYTENGEESGIGTGRLLEDHRKYEYTEQEKYAQSPCNPYLLPDMWTLETVASFVKRSSNSLYPIGFNSPNGIMGYRTVYELFDENGNIGKTKYDYRRILPKTYNSDYYTGVLNLSEVTDVTKYNDIGDPVQKTKTSHVTKELKYLYGININRLSELENPCPLCPLDEPGIGYPIPYNLDYSEWYVVDQVTTTEYDDDFEETLQTVEKFNYDHPAYKSITSKNLYNSKGEEFKTIYSYPYNFPTTSTYQQMVTNHIIAPIVKEEHFKIDGNGLPEFLMGKTVNYENQGGKVFRPTSIVSDKAYSPVDLRIEYGYDTKGNIVEANKAGGAHTYYVWGYKEQYPIAKIENFDPVVDLTATISGLIASARVASNSDDDNCMDGQSCGESNLRTALRNLRSALPIKAMMSSYTFDPHIGVTSMTDPKGYTVYYKYDSYNRLQYVKDAEGHVVNETKYRYKQ